MDRMPMAIVFGFFDWLKKHKADLEGDWREIKKRRMGDLAFSYVSGSGGSLPLRLKAHIPHFELPF